MKMVAYYLKTTYRQYYQKVALTPLTTWVCMVKEGCASARLIKGRVALKKKGKKKFAHPLKLWSDYEGGKGGEVITERAAFFNEEKTMETPSIRTNFPYSLATHSVMKTFAIDLDG